jgi:putative transposase
MEYRRDRITGGTYFFTVVTDGRRPVFHDPAAVGLLRGAFRRVYADRPFVIDAMVVLPDHLHTVRTLPKDDSDYSMRWRLIKRTFTSAVRFQKPIWQKRFWEHRIRDDDDWRRHLDYIHWNPVKHGLAHDVWEWPYSSFQKHVRLGAYPPTWRPAVEPAL